MSKVLATKIEKEIDTYQLIYNIATTVYARGLPAAAAEHYYFYLLLRLFRIQEQKK